MFRRNGNNADTNFHAVAKIGDSMQGKDGLIVKTAAVQRLISVKGCHDMNTALIKALVSQKRSAQRADTNQNRIVHIAITEIDFYVVHKIVHQKAGAGTARRAAHDRQFFSHLNFIQAKVLCDCRGRYVLALFPLKCFQIAQITGHPFERFF